MPSDNANTCAECGYVSETSFKECPICHLGAKLGVQPIEPRRPAINSKEYVETASLDPFANMDAVVEEVCEESREDCVKITLDGERYEIYPATKARVIVKHFHEKDPEYDKNGGLAAAESIVKPSISVANQNLAHESPSDRELKEKAGALLEYTRVTSDPAMWEAVERARKARERITFELPRGKELDYKERRSLEQLFECIAADDVPGALGHFADFSKRHGDNTRVAKLRKKVQKRFGRSK